MGKFKFTETELKGLFVIEPTVFEDARGYFMETYHKEEFSVNGITVDFVQDNQSKSTRGVLRGLHYQKRYPQGKLIRVMKGEVFDAAVDIRESSETYGKWYGAFLSEQNRRQLYVPKGFAHGFLVVSEDAEFFYKCTDFYHPEDEGGIIWNDKDVNVDWPLERVSNLIISEKDKSWEGFRP